MSDDNIRLECECGNDTCKTSGGIILTPEEWDSLDAMKNVFITFATCKPPEGNKLIGRIRCYYLWECLENEDLVCELVGD